MYLKDVGDLGECRVSAWPGAPPSHPLDIVCVIRQRMSSRNFHQVALLVPGSGLLGWPPQVETLSRCELAGLLMNSEFPAGDFVPFLRGRLTVQPVGDFPRKEISAKDQKDVVARAEEVFRTGQLSETRLIVVFSQPAVLISTWCPCPQHFL